MRGRTGGAGVPQDGAEPDPEGSAKDPAEAIQSDSGGAAPSLDKPATSDSAIDDDRPVVRRRTRRRDSQPSLFSEDEPDEEQP